MLDYLNKLKQRVEYWYFLYELNIQTSICEPWEKRFINCLLLTVVSIIAYACYAYLPGYVRTLLYFITPVGVSQRFLGSEVIDKTTFAEQSAELLKEFL